ncbi:MAG TPA: cytochrome c [Candidatus Dormibacteraeota bacterium]|nr:cytochrome c [Candidatus Dormibacteraeota bacterium]
MGTIFSCGLAAKRRLGKFAILSLNLIFFLGLRNSRARPQTIAQGTAAQDTAAQNAAIERGRKQFEQSCGFCHGPDATGARGPDLIRSPLVAHDIKGDLIGDVIRRGRPDKGMPPLALADQQVADIAAFLHARVAEGVESAGIPRAYPVQKLLTGNPEAGKAFFNGPGGCKNCHSPTGDLAAIATKYSPIELEARMLYPGRRKDGPHTTAVVTLPSGEQIQGQLVHADDFVVGLLDGSGWYRSFSRNRVKVELQDRLAAHSELLRKLTQADVHNLFAYLESLK